MKILFENYEINTAFQCQKQYKKLTYILRAKAISQKLLLGGIAIFALRRGDAKFWEKHLPEGPAIFQHFCFCDSVVFCY